MKSMHMFLPLVATIGLSTQASAALMLTPPPGTDNLEFQFAPGECTDKVALRATGLAPGTTTEVTTYSCSRDIKKFVFRSTGAFDGLLLFGIVPAGSPETVGRTTVTLVDAYWTTGPAIAESVWPGAASSYVALVPEPGVWAMMIAGFGAVAAALRRKGRGISLAQPA